MQVDIVGGVAHPCRQGKLICSRALDMYINNVGHIRGMYIHLGLWLAYNCNRWRLFSFMHLHPNAACPR